MNAEKKFSIIDRTSSLPKQRKNIEIELSQLKKFVESMEENVLLEIEFEKGKGGLDNAGIRSCEY